MEVIHKHLFDKASRIEKVMMFQAQRQARLARERRFLAAKKVAEEARLKEEKRAAAVAKEPQTKRLASKISSKFR